MIEPKPLVLLVDDEPANIQVVAKALQADYEVKIATDGRTALELAHHMEQPDLILLDVLMPGLSGYEVCQRLKDDDATKNIPIIFVSAKADAEDVEHGFRLGAVDYIVRPFELPVVRARVRNHVKLKLKTDLLESLASLDGLTGIYNRRRFEVAFNDEWKRAVRNRVPLALVIADVDNFKQYNDHYGHGVGDECLQKIAVQIDSARKRPGDLAARFGGEEFVMLLPETTAPGACHVAERFRSTVEALNIPHVKSSVGAIVTVSAGCAAMVPTRDNEPSLFLQAADQALYEAKKEGRNRVACARD